MKLLALQWPAFRHTGTLQLLNMAYRSRIYQNSQRLCIITSEEAIWQLRMGCINDMQQNSGVGFLTSYTGVNNSVF